MLNLLKKKLARMSAKLESLKQRGLASEDANEVRYAFNVGSRC